MTLVARSSRLPFIMFILTLAAIPASSLSALAFPAEAAIKSYRELRQATVTIQSTPDTCGAAAVATLLNLFGRPVTESHVLAHIGPLERGITMAQMRLAALALGAAQGEGYRFRSLEALRRYYDQTGLPVILHLASPQRHYVVLLGLLDDVYVLADPAWGIRSVPADELVEQWSGAVLVLLPADFGSVEEARRKGKAAVRAVAERRTFAAAVLASVATR